MNEESFEKPLLEAGCDRRTVRDLLGHEDVKTTMSYTHVLNKGGREGKVPWISYLTRNEPRIGQEIMN